MHFSYRSRPYGEISDSKASDACLVAFFFKRLPSSRISYANGKTTTLQLFLDSLSPKNTPDALSGDKLKIALFGELSLEEAMDLSQDRQILEL
jgi:hypothetical protein